MTDTTTATDVPVFDTSTAAGRLRILWGATADPDLAMSDDDVADVATVLREHAEMVAELERLRAQVAGFPEQLADAQEMALDKLVEAFGEGWDNCRMHLEDEARLKRGVAVTQYSNQLPWPTYQAGVADDA